MKRRESLGLADGWPSPLRRPSEADLEKYGSDLLALDGWRSLKTDPVSDRSRGKGFGELGMADRLYLRYAGRYTDYRLDLEYAATKIEAIAPAQVLWIEWKRIRPGRHKAEKARADQQLWIAAERARGALVLLAGEDFPATPEAFLAWYRGSGLMRREIL